MVTQYVMKATHINSAPFTIVYWVVSGAPDNTGAQSGYNIADLTNISTDYTTTVSTSAVSGGTNFLVPQRYTPIDNGTFINWKLDESASPFLNSGTAGTINLVSAGTNGTPGATGIFNTCVSFNGSTGGLSTSATSVGEPTDPTSFTISVWVNINVFLANGIIFMKHREASPSGNNYSFSIQMSGSVDGSWVFYWTNSVPTMAATASSGAGRIIAREWCLLTVTFSSGTVNMYMNGSLAGTSTDATHTSVNFGTHGRYSVGYLADGNVTPSDAQIDDIRVQNGVMTQAAIMAMYRNGVGLFDGQFGNPNLGIISDGYANLPTAGAAGRLFMPTDGLSVLRDNGTTWKAFGPVQPIILPPTGVSGWTWVNQQGASATNASTGIQLISAGQTSPISGGLVTTGIGTTSVQSGAVWTCTFDSFSTNALSGSWGVMMFESGSNKWAVMRVFIHQNANNNFLTCFQVAFSYGVNSTETSATSRFGVFSPHGPTYARLRISGGNVIGEITQDLQQPTWAQMGSVATTTAFTTAPNNVGVCFDPAGISGKTTYITYYHFASS